uniref:Competence protein n=1 Tax=Strongyloides venezuelensis TaxID=75913 RepID=A0A0K0FLS0_STRVS
MKFYILTLFIYIFLIIIYRDIRGKETSLIEVRNDVYKFQEGEKAFVNIEYKGINKNTSNYNIRCYKNNKIMVNFCPRILFKGTNLIALGKMSKVMEGDYLIQLINKHGNVKDFGTFSIQLKDN